MTDDLNLGRLLGRREAFNIVAARCSAAEAMHLRQIRDEKRYLNHAKDWEEFCNKYLHMGKANANRLIHLLDEFGPAYFEVSQLTRISAAAYRAIAPAIRDQALQYNGEAIALIPENAEKVAAAVADLRRAAAAAAEEAAGTPEPARPIPALEKTCSDAVREIESVIALRQYPAQVRAVICSMRSRLDRLELTV